ncbi:MAG: ABC transporter permease [Lachnospiraceae bacterium]|nr:ABC transporter permease [Lachnospiraceae bacterium]
MNRFILRIKLLFRDRTACLCYAVSALVMFCLLLGLASVSEERSAVPIGLVVEDDSKEALDLAESIRNTAAVYVTEGTEEELKEELLNGYINCIFIIDEGYGERVRMSDNDELVTVISGTDDRMSVVIGDIIGGSMLYDICLNKAYRAYLSVGDNEKLSKEAYNTYVIGLKNDPSFEFSFDVTYRNPDSQKIEESEITNGMIYRQMITGMLAMLLCLMAFVSCNCFCLEYENGVAYRLKELPGNRFPSFLMDFFGIFVYTIPLSIIAGFLNADIKGVLYSIVYLGIMCIVCTVLSKSVKKTEAYQLVGAVLVIGLGILGFVSVFAGIIGGPEFLKYTPNAIYINLLL